MKGETIEDMFADDVDLGDTFDFSTGEVVEVKKEENSDMFDNDDESFLFQANQAAEMFSIKNCRIRIAELHWLYRF